MTAERAAGRLASPVVLLCAALAAAALLGDLDHPSLWAARELNALRVVAILGAATISALAVHLEWFSRLGVPLMAFLGWGLVASVAGPHPARSVVAWALLTAVAVAATQLAMLGQRHAAAVVWALATLVSVAAAVQDARGAERSFGRLFGTTLEPNTLAHIAGVGLVVAVVEFAHSGTLVRAAYAMSTPLHAWAIWESQTRTVIAAVGVSMLVLVARRRPAMLLGMLIVGVVAASLTDLTGAATDASRRGEGEDLTELSGRNRIWRQSLELTFDGLATGSGLASGPTDFDRIAVSGGLSTHSPSSHSLPLEIARETGLIGLALAAWIVAAALRRRGFELLSSPMLVYLTVTAVTMPTSGFAGVVTLAWLVELERPGRPDRSPARHSGEQLATAL